MARSKVNRLPQAKDVGDEQASPPLRRTGRQPKPKVNVQDTPVPELGDDETEDEHDDAPSPAPAPASLAKTKSKGRKSTKGVVSILGDSSPKTAPQPEKQAEKNKGRRGGNKRKWDHEYCLTCSHYGRACGGRREGYEGCAVCREPNREKGEKLRECLWADPERGITTYTEASTRLKAAKAAARGQRPRPSAAKRQRHSSNDARYASTPTDGYAVPVSSGSAPHGYSLAPPPIRRQLDLRPPQRAGNPEWAPAAQSCASHELPQGVHRPTVIHLNGNEPEQQARMAHPQQLIQLSEAFTPFYDPNQNAYVLPAYPRTNYLPPPAYRNSAIPAYISPYDQPISLPPIPPPRTADFRVSSPSFTQPHPSDISGKLVRRWSEIETRVTTVGGYDFKAKSWKSETSSESNPQQQRDANEGASNAIASEKAVSDASSPLSSAAEVEESMLNGCRSKGDINNQVAKMLIGKESHLLHSDQEIDSEEQLPDSDEDRAQSMLNSIFRKATRKRKRGPEPLPKTPRFVAVNENSDDRDDGKAGEVVEGGRRKVRRKLSPMPETIPVKLTNGTGNLKKGKQVDKEDADDAPNMEMI